MIKTVESIVLEAGKKIVDSSMNYKNDVFIKEDDSPVTKADLLSHEFICTSLKSQFDYPIISEEDCADYSVRRNWETFWLIDPLDGTKNFIKGMDDFTVNVALIKKNRPVLGVIGVPMKNTVYSAEVGRGCFKNGERLIRSNINTSPIGVTSCFHHSEASDLFFQKNQINQIISLGASYKFCKLAEGEVDVYPRFVPTKEWDTAAGEVILEESGCTLLDLNHQPLLYNKQNIENPFFVAFYSKLNINF